MKLPLVDSFHLGNKQQQCLNKSYKKLQLTILRIPSGNSGNARNIQIVNHFTNSWRILDGFMLNYSYATFLLTASQKKPYPVVWTWDNGAGTEIIERSRHILVWTKATPADFEQRCIGVDKRGWHTTAVNIHYNRLSWPHFVLLNFRLFHSKNWC